MASRNDLVDWVLQALTELGGEAKISAIAKHIWDAHKIDLERSGELFYTWQYDMRWAANKLRHLDKLSTVTKRSYWALKK